MRRTQKEITKAYETYHNMVWRICLMQLGNEQDANDGVQETFLRLIRFHGSFRDEEHEKAWLIRTAVNYCRDVQKSSWRKKRAEELPEELLTGEEAESSREVYETMQELPEQYRVILYLHYYEGYSLKEIAMLLRVNPSTLRSRFAKAKEIMKTYLEED